VWRAVSVLWRALWPEWRAVGGSVAGSRPKVAGKIEFMAGYFTKAWLLMGHPECATGSHQKK